MVDFSNPASLGLAQPAGQAITGAPGIAFLKDVQIASFSLAGLAPLGKPITGLNGIFNAKNAQAAQQLVEANWQALQSVKAHGDQLLAQNVNSVVISGDIHHSGSSFTGHGLGSMSAISQDIELA